MWSINDMFLFHKNDIDPKIKYPLAQFDNCKSLYTDKNKFFIVNNICPHQGSLILKEPSESFRCQYHGWSWDDQGKPVDSGFTKICNSSVLARKEVFETNGLIFTENIDLKKVLPIDLSYMNLIEQRVDRVFSDYKNIIDVFLDVDHIPCVHENVYDQIGIEKSADVNWFYFDWGNLQLVEKTGNYSKEYKESLINNSEENIAAAWLTMYPGTMIEWQPGSLFITTCVKKESYTDVYIFKYKDQRYDRDNWSINELIWETAWRQDKHQSESIIKTCDVVSHLEESKIHFRNWLKDNDLGI